MPSQITNNIWIGNSNDSTAEDRLKKLGINAILNVANDLPEILGWRQGFHSSHCGLVDGEGNTKSLYLSAITQLHALVEMQKKILVHCHEGKSRSAAIVVAYLDGIDGQGWDYWENEVKAKRSIVQINLVHKNALEILRNSIKELLIK